MAEKKETRIVEIIVNGNKIDASLKELKASAAVLYNQWAKAKKGTQEYIEASKNLKEVRARIADIEKDAKKVGGAMSELKNAMGALGLVMTATFVVQKITEFFTQSITKAKEFQTSLQNLSAITGASGNDLKFLAEQAKLVAKETGVGAVQVVEAYKLMAGAKPELLENKDALAAMTREAIILSQAAGMELPQAALALTDAMNQFGAPAAEASRYINALAAGANAGAAEIPDITNALLKFGVAANSSNVSIEESVGLIETLAEKGLKGAEAGTALRNVMAKLSAPDILPKEALAALSAAGVDINVLSDATLPFSKRLDELGKIQGNTSAITRVFGLENKIAAEVLIENRDSVESLTKAVTGTQSAYESAAKNTDTYEFKQKRLAATLESFQISVGEKLLPILGDFIDGLINVANGADPLLSVFGLIGEIFNIVANTISSLVSNFIPLNDGASTSTSIMSLLGKALMLATIPLRLLAGTIQTTVDSLGILINKGKEVANFFGAEFELNPKANFDTLKSNAEKNYKSIQGTITEVFSSQETAVKETTVVQDKELAKQVENTQAAEQKKALITSVERKKIAKEQERQVKEDLAKAKKAAEDELKAAELISEKKIALIADEYERRRAEITASADKEIKDLVGTEEQKKLLIKQIRQQQWNELDALEDARNEEKLKNDLELENRRASALAELKLMQAEENGSPEDILEAQLEQMELEREMKLEDHTLLKEEVDLINAEYDQKERDAADAMADYKRKKIADGVNQGLQAASQLAGAINALQQAETNKKLADAEKVKNVSIQKLDEQLAAGIISKDQYEQQKSKIEEDFDKKTAKLKNEQSKKNKKMAIIQAVINTAMAVTSALASPMWPASIAFAALAAVLGGLQIAAISKQPVETFAKGGFTAQKPKSPFKKWSSVIDHFAVGGYTGGSQASFKDGGWVRTQRQGIIGEAGSEYVLPHWMISSPKYANVVGYLESERQRRKFAAGGFTDTASAAQAPTVGQTTNSAAETSGKFDHLITEVQGLRTDMNMWQSKLRVELPIVEVEDGLNELGKIRGESVIS